MNGKNFKAGLFVVLSIVILVMMILRVSQGGLLFSNTYPIYLELDSAMGLAKNTPVKIAGVDVGLVEDIVLSDQSHAIAKLSVRKGVAVAKDARATVKTTGVLGDAYIDITQAGPVTEKLKEGAVITDVSNYGDFNAVTSQVSAIADDVKAITAQMRKLMAGDNSTFEHTMKNIEKISASLSRVTAANEGNINAIIKNLGELSHNLNYLVARNTGRVDRTMYNLEDISDTIARGEGTVGRLIKDDDTVERLNDALDNVNTLLGDTQRFKIDLGMHTEYLAGTGDVKNYVSLSLKPRPDKYFLFEVVSDPDPSFDTTIEETSVTAGGATTTLTTQTRTKELDAFRFSLQMAKKFYDFTLRGGLIESSGGIGLDYDGGPFGVSFSAFNFKSKEGERPHLKVMGKTQITRTFYFLGGVDDFIAQNQDLAWYMGAGLSFTDDDIKSLLGIFAAGVR